MRLLALLSISFMTFNTVQAQQKKEKNYPKVVVPIEIKSTRSLKESFEYIVPIDLEHIFNKPYKLIPSIDSTSNEEAWFYPGMKRTVHFSDGSSSEEELLSLSPSSGFTYKVSGFTSSLRMLIKQINGSWTFEEREDGRIHIAWTYEFVPKNFIARFLVKHIVRKQIRVPMENALHIIKDELESGKLYQYERRVGSW